MQITRFRIIALGSILILMEISSLSQGISSLFGNYMVHSTGVIDYGARPLHTEGRYIKDDLGRTVYLRGVWKGGYADSCVGWWERSGLRWDESVVRASMRTLKVDWGINVFNIFFWAEWWIDNASTTLNGNPTDKPYRYCIKETLRLAMEYGLYVHIRMWGVSPSHGRQTQPYPPYDNSGIFNSTDDFANFWAGFADELKNYPNVIFGLYDEPAGNQTLWFEAATKCINAIRVRGINHLIVPHWFYGASCLWMEKWVNEGRPTYNIVFSNHIYRYHGTFEGNPNSPTDIDYIRTQLGDNVGSHRAYKYVTDTYNIPIWVNEIGAYMGYTDDDEYVYFRNTLAVLNEWGLHYIGYHWAVRETTWSMTTFTGEGPPYPPNRVGQALIDAIMELPVPPTHHLTINSYPSNIKFTLDGIERRTPYGPKLLFQELHTTVMPSTATVYSHTPIFGNTEIGGKGGYAPWIYTAGPYILNETVIVSTLYLYTGLSGNAKVALYDEAGGNPNHLLTQSEPVACKAESWNFFNITEVQLSPGKYFMAIKLDTHEMLTGVSRAYWGKFRKHDYTLDFPDPFGTVEGTTGVEYTVYVAAAPLQIFTYNFVYWEDDSTNPERTINLTTNMTLTATYELPA